MVINMVKLDINEIMKEIKEAGIDWEMAQDVIRFIKPHTTAVTTISELVDCLEKYINKKYTLLEASK